MSVLLQVCFVIVTIAVAAIAVAMIRMTLHFRKTSEEISELTREGLEAVRQVKAVTQEAGEIVAAFRDVAPRIRGVVSRIESVGERVASLSDAVVQEVELPVRTAVAVARGVRYGALELIALLARRFVRRASSNGESNPDSPPTG